jgi:hypothetical protein
VPEPEPTFEVGKSYRTRDGQTAKITSRQGSETYLLGSKTFPLVGIVGHQSHSWREANLPSAAIGSK